MKSGAKSSLVVIGHKSNLSVEFTKLMSSDDSIVRGYFPYPILNADKYLICAGYLCGKPILEQSGKELKKGWESNFLDIVVFCEKVLAVNHSARICIIGSESGYMGSFDMLYAGAKAALHLYIEKKQLKPNQQLVGIAPGIIEDAGMTTRRTDLDNLQKRRQAHPKGRFLLSVEVAKLAHYLLSEEAEYISNTVVQVHGGRA